MVELGHLLTPAQLKAKVGESTQSRVTPFRDGIPRNSWLKWFRNRNPHLVMRQPQPLDSNRARALCSPTIERFYSNLRALHKQYQYQPNCIWNIDESGVQANKNGHTKIFALRGIRSVQKLVPNERESK